MIHPNHVMPFDTTIEPHQSRISDSAVVDTPYVSISWRCFESTDGRALSGI